MCAAKPRAPGARPFPGTRHRPRTPARGTHPSPTRRPLLAGPRTPAAIEAAAAAFEAEHRGPQAERDFEVVLGVVRDEWGVERAVRYPLERRDGEADE